MSWIIGWGILALSAAVFGVLTPFAVWSAVREIVLLERAERADKAEGPIEVKGKQLTLW
jgi:hypothetical protein